MVLAKAGREIMYAAIIPNGAARQPLDAYMVTVAEVQNTTGLDCFQALDDAEEPLGVRTAAVSGEISNACPITHCGMHSP
jgi:DNA/RNA endonuclease G (NUC1)